MRTKPIRMIANVCKEYPMGTNRTKPNATKLNWIEKERIACVRVVNLWQVSYFILLFHRVHFEMCSHINYCDSFTCIAALDQHPRMMKYVFRFAKFINRRQWISKGFCIMLNRMVWYLNEVTSASFSITRLMCGESKCCSDKCVSLCECNYKAVRVYEFRHYITVGATRPHSNGGRHAISIHDTPSIQI